MKKTECSTAKLGKGEVSVYDFGDAKLHAYKTNDLIDDEVFIIEKSGRGFVNELYPEYAGDNYLAMTAGFFFGE